jgi:hypothetical protein
VIERITQVLRLVILLWSLLLTLWAWTVVSVLITMLLTTIATIWTTVTTISTLWTLTALTALTGRTLYIVCRLLNQYAMRELILTCLWIDLKQLNLDMVTLLDTSLLDSLEALPVNLRDMQQAILARHNLYEAAIRHD